jgi:hypothetical protein
MSMVGTLNAEGMDPAALSAQGLISSKLPVADLINLPKRI